MGFTQNPGYLCNGHLTPTDLAAKHPEAKFLGHDGHPCDSLTRGLLRRCHIVANVHRYVGKETSRRWEQGDDMSMVDFRCAEYSDGKVVADKETRKRIMEIGIRKVARETGIHTDTVNAYRQRPSRKTRHTYEGAQISR